MFLINFPFSYDCPAENKSVFHNSAQLTEEAFQENPIINWDAILWVKRPLELWAVELFLALISLTKALLVAYLGYKVELLDIIRIQKILLINILIIYTGQHMADNNVISLHSRTRNNYTIYTYSKI